MENTSLIKAIQDFCEKNNILSKDIKSNIIDEDKAVLRIFDINWNIEKSRNASKHIYHGNRYDIFIWTPLTRTSGWIEYDKVLTDEYKYKCK
jgi:hypothetical protein